MTRTSLMAAGIALLCGSAAAQNLESIYPVTAPIRNAGTVNLATGQWTRAGTQNAGSTVVYNNTCTWTGGAFYRGHAPCETTYDEGRLPSTGDPSAPVGAQDSYNILCFSFAYCTFWANAFPVEIGFWNNLNGACVGGIPPTPPPPATTATAYFDLTPLGLPGSPANGVQACWIVTIDTSPGFTMLADGDGIFDNNPALDLFTWSFSHNNPNNAAGEDGMLINGDPNAAPPGSCSFGLACGTDPFSGAPCGTGLGATDNEWVNVDGVAVGNTTTGPIICPGSPAGGTGCYFFGGYPTNPFASFWMTLEANTQGGCSQPTTYCTPKITSNGCVPSIGFNNLPSVSAGNFQATATQIEGATIGVFFYSTGGPNAQPFQGGFLCILPPVVRLPAQTSGGTFGTCTGNFTTNLTATLNNVGVGNSLWGQYWFRDNQAATGTGLSNALAITVCP